MEPNLDTEASTCKYFLGVVSQHDSKRITLELRPSSRVLF